MVVRQCVLPNIKSVTVTGIKIIKFDKRKDLFHVLYHYYLAINYFLVYTLCVMLN